ncbi:uncharacterized protein C8orf88 homolog [Microcaecilia unicolor]|uniref:Uncharacterized protein C8orf88 homolog n=1 Tax=Microcaecilia unicolor TaxID=1415580 RepID=A0A6P7X646_9AMPH|nr:uncharacterized protein C8orf88 homolog [Microcaecilia unicolor]
MVYGTLVWIPNTMETKKLIRRSLQPARPLRRRLSSDHAISTLMVDFPAEFSPGDHIWLHDEVNLCHTNKNVQVLAETEIPSQPPQLQSHDSKERIRYSRDFLMELSSLSISKQKPEYLPDHPVVLQKSRGGEEMC